MTTPSTSTVDPANGDAVPEPCTDPIVTASASHSSSTTSTSAFAAPGVLRASPSCGVPVMSGMPARSKSLRTQSAGESVSVPSGIRDAPPGAWSPKVPSPASSTVPP